MRRPYRNPTYRLRRTVDSLPRRTKEAMLRGIDSNRIVVGVYVDPGSGGICPMLAAHRNGGRTSVASFARAWDAYTGAKRPRRATRREVRTLRAMLESSLAAEGVTRYASSDVDNASIAELAAQIRAEREQLAGCSPAAPADEPLAESTPAQPTRAEPSSEPTLPERPKRRITIRRRRHDPYLDLLAVAEQALAEEGVWERVDEREHA